MPRDDRSETLKDLEIQVYLVQIPLREEQRVPGLGEKTEITPGRRKDDRPKTDPLRLRRQIGPLHSPR
jgi:hypothetical protein